MLGPPVTRYRFENILLRVLACRPAGSRVNGVVGGPLFEGGRFKVVASVILDVLLKDLRLGLRLTVLTGFLEKLTTDDSGSRGRGVHSLTTTDELRDRPGSGLGFDLVIQTLIGGRGGLWPTSTRGTSSLGRLCLLEGGELN